MMDLLGFVFYIYLVGNIKKNHSLMVTGRILSEAQIIQQRITVMNRRIITKVCNAGLYLLTP